MRVLLSTSGTSIAAGVGPPRDAGDRETHRERHHVFERSDKLIRLPPAPRHYDSERLGRSADVLRSLRTDGTMSRDAFFAAIPGGGRHERDVCDALLEDDGTIVTLSAFGLVVTTAAEHETARVLLGTAARRALDASEGAVRAQLAMMLDSVGERRRRASADHDRQPRGTRHSGTARLRASRRIHRHTARRPWRPRASLAAPVAIVETAPRWRTSARLPRTSSCARTHRRSWPTRTAAPSRRSTTTAIC